MQEKRIRVAVIDDHRVFAEALASRLSDEPDLEVVGTAVGFGVSSSHLFPLGVPTPGPGSAIPPVLKPG